MGRHSTVPKPGAITQKVHLTRVYVNGQGYDVGGAYWGVGAPLWWAYTDDGQLDTYYRARNRPAAKAELMEILPGIRFYR